MRRVEDVTPDEILSFWFPDGIGEASVEEVSAFFDSRMHGGMDDAICQDYADATLAAAKGRYDHWDATSEGRLALILLLDQFPRSLWRDTPAAFGQDIKATRVAIAGIKHGHYEELQSVVHRQFYLICLYHCEGPDHLERLDLSMRLNEDFRAIAPPGYEEMIERGLAHAKRGREIIQQFGRHPHRNEILGRVSTPDELIYIENGDFPHLKKQE